MRHAFKPASGLDKINCFVFFAGCIFICHGGDGAKLKHLSLQWVMSECIRVWGASLPSSPEVGPNVWSNWHIHNCMWSKYLEQLTYPLLRLVHMSGANDLATPTCGPHVWSKWQTHSNTWSKCLEQMALSLVHIRTITAHALNKIGTNKLTTPRTQTKMDTYSRPSWVKVAFAPDPHE